jgi:hypothetical protein
MAFEALQSFVAAGASIRPAIHNPDGKPNIRRLRWGPPGPNGMRSARIAPRALPWRLSGLWLDLARLPRLFEEGWQRAVEAQDGKPTLLGVGLDPVAACHALGLLR